MSNIIQELAKEVAKTDLPRLNPGDTVKVFVRIKEGNKERTQAFEGVIIKKRGSGAGQTITVRRVFQGVGVERIFPLHSPKVDKIKVIKKGNVRRAKLYYMRDRIGGRATKIKEQSLAQAQGQAQSQAAK